MSDDQIRPHVREAYARRLDAAGGRSTEMAGLVRSGRPLEPKGLHMVALRAIQDSIDKAFALGAGWSAGHVLAESDVPSPDDIARACDELCKGILQE